MPRQCGYPAKFFQTHNGRVIPTEIPFDLVVDFLPEVLTGSNLVIQSQASNAQPTGGFEAVLGQSTAIRAALTRARRIALRDVPALDERSGRMACQRRPPDLLHPVGPANDHGLHPASAAEAGAQGRDREARPRPRAAAHPRGPTPGPREWTSRSSRSSWATGRNARGSSSVRQGDEARDLVRDAPNAGEEGGVSQSHPSKPPQSRGVPRGERAGLHPRGGRMSTSAGSSRVEGGLPRGQPGVASGPQRCHLDTAEDRIVVCQQVVE